MLGALLIVLLIMGHSMLAGTREMIEDAFSDPNWMNFEDLENSDII